MPNETDVIYNGACPICAREIAFYRRRAGDDGALRFVDLNGGDLGGYDLTPDQAARRFHVYSEGRLLSGVDAFAVLWRATPGLRWLGRLVTIRPLRRLAGVVYDRIVAPWRYRRQRRRRAAR